jgi:hypothetical protein
MLKKSASGVLASLRGSTYRSVRLASSLTEALPDGLFEHPETILTSTPYGRFQRHFVHKSSFFSRLIGALKDRRPPLDARNGRSSSPPARAKSPKSAFLAKRISLFTRDSRDLREKRDESDVFSSRVVPVAHVLLVSRTTHKQRTTIP